jgi:AhpD family alkylhydroperoxidase
MEKRINIGRIDPAAYKAMDALDEYISNSKLNPIHRELIKIRASQLNGCAYCIDMHTRDAINIGVTEQRIFGLSAWWETPFFYREERAILKLTEEITLIYQRVSDETYQNALELLGEEYLAQVIMAIVAINGWNRIGVATRMQPAIREKQVI